MSDSRTAVDAAGRERDERARSTVTNGVIGGVVGVVLTFVPGSTVLGGGVAGYLEGGTPRDGATVGAIAGLVALVPMALFAAAVLFFLPFGVMIDPAGAAFFWLALAFAVALGLLYTIGLSVLGGVVGVYVREEM